jgi:antitoxin ParD1/3/4
LQLFVLYLGSQRRWGTQMKTLSVTLSEEMIDAIKARVDAGTYASPSAVVEEAIRALLREEAEHEEVMESIRARVRASLADPRPDLTSDEMWKELEGLFEKYR